MKKNIVTDRLGHVQVAAIMAGRAGAYLSGENGPYFALCLISSGQNQAMAYISEGRKLFLLLLSQNGWVYHAFNG